jgi:hypothetical protein
MLMKLRWSNIFVETTVTASISSIEKCPEIRRIDDRDVSAVTA